MVQNGRPHVFVPASFVVSPQCIPMAFKIRPKNDSDAKYYYCLAVTGLRPGGQLASAWRPAGEIFAAIFAKTPWTVWS
jgi:hypothetical protein